MAGGPEKVAAAPAAAGSNNAALSCIKCGRDVSEADAFCIFCGTKVSLSVAQQKKAAPPAPPAKKPAAPAPPAAPAAPAAKPAAPAAPAAKPAAPAAKPAAPAAKQPAAKPAAKPFVPAARPPASGGSTASTATPPPSSGSSSASRPAPLRPAASAPANNARGSAQGSRPQPSPQPPRAASEGRVASGGRGSLDAAPSGVAGLEKLWVPDDFSSDCMDCKTPFGFRARRHHCRVCGLLFCRACVQHKMTIPSSFGYGSQQQRCCRNCITALQMKAITTPADVFAQRKGSSARENRDRDGNNSHYELLGVSKDATPEEIARQYKAKSRAMDPTKAEDQETLERINDAYRTLQDPAARLRHDSEQQVRDSMVSDGPNGPNGSVTASAVSYAVEARSDQTECQVCFRPFKLGRRQHHCRRCTRSVCNQCSEGSKSIPELGFPTPVRHCQACMDAPPAFIKPVMDPVTPPPAGFEYLARLDILVSVKATGSGDGDSEAFRVRTYCEPNAASVQQAHYALSDADRAVANEYAIDEPRTNADFEWLLTAYRAYTNANALPNFPDRRSGQRSRGEREKMLQTFLYGCLLHPLLRDADCLKAFLALPVDELRRFQKSGKKQLYDSDKYNDVVTALRLEFEKAQLRAKLNELVERQKAHTTRVAEQTARIESQKKREASQKVRAEQAATRFKALEARKEAQTERMEREKQRFEKQSSTTHILFFDTVRDESVRRTEEETRIKEKVEFTKSKDAFQADTTQWNNDMAQWSKHRANWSEAHNPAVSKDIANDFIVQSYGIYHAAQEKGLGDVPRDLVDLHAQIVKMQEKEPSFLEEEGNAVDDEWMKLAKEREHWTATRANMKREDEMCRDEDVRYKQEHEYVRQEREAREKKKKTIEADLLVLKTEVVSRAKSIAQRRTRHEALDVEYEKEWRGLQKARDDTTNARLDEHKNRITRGKKRTEIFADQLARQTKSQRMLLFKRAALTEERKKDVKLFDEHREDSKNALEEARNALLITPEYVSRLDADMKVRAEELQAVKESNQRTPQEGGDPEVDERDEFMNDVRRRRAQFQKDLDDEAAQLETENQLCSSLLTRMKEHIAKLETEVKNAAHEDKLIAEFNSIVDQETKLLTDEEAKREEKKAMITEIMNSAGNWVLDALHQHSSRKKVEADRLVKQAVRAADLQKLVQHFTHRVIDQEERIMRQKQRILNGEHKVEMLKSSENWYQYVTGYTGDPSKKDAKLLESSRAERAEDLKEAARLQKDDDVDMKAVVKELAASRKVAKEKTEKREIWAQVEDVYALAKAQEKDEDMMMTSQIRALLQQLGEAFEMLANRLLEEDESLQHASTQLEGEVDSIAAFMERMESEESALCSTEKTSLAKEAQVRRSEADLIEQRARALLDSYKQMQSEHAKYPVELDKVRSKRSEREKPVLPREAEVEAAKRLVKARNYYDRKACAEFAKKFRVDADFKEVRDVLEWLKAAIDRDIKRQEKWLEASRKDRKAIESLKGKGKEINWEQDTLERIPALKDIQRKMTRGTSSASSASTNKGGSNSGGMSMSEAVHPSEQWIVELLKFKKNIAEIDAGLLKSIAASIEAAHSEEESVNTHLKKMKTDKEYVLNSIRFIDQEEAKAIRSTGKGGRQTPSSDNGSFINEPQLTPMGASGRSASPNPASARAPSPKPTVRAPSPKPSPPKTKAPSPAAPAAAAAAPKPAAPAPKAPAPAAPAAQREAVPKPRPAVAKPRSEEF